MQRVRWEHLNPPSFFISPTLMLAGNIPNKTQTLALAIYDAFQAGNDALAACLVLITSGICAFILIFADSLLGGSR